MNALSHIAIFFLGSLLQLPVSASAATHLLEGPLVPWLWPLLAILGIAMQLLAAFLRNKALIVGGFILLAIGTIHERDLTLLIGDTLATIGLCCCIRKI